MKAKKSVDWRDNIKIERLYLTDRKDLLSYLQGQVFHLTTRTSYNEIKKTEEILNNQSECFPINRGSEMSFGNSQGYVCLFDLRIENAEILQRTLECYYFLGPTWFSKHGRKYESWDLVYFLVAPKYYNQIIPNSRVQDHYKKTGRHPQATPNTEVWIDGKVPFSWLEKILLVKIKERLPSRDTDAGKYYWACYDLDKQNDN